MHTIIQLFPPLMNVLRLGPDAHPSFKLRITLGAEVTWLSDSV